MLLVTNGHAVGNNGCFGVSGGVTVMNMPQCRRVSGNIVTFVFFFLSQKKNIIL